MPQEPSLPSKRKRPLISVAELTGARVHAAGDEKSLGRVRCFVFHPSKRSCVGLLVKRPDAALMFRRKDEFVAFDGFDVRKGAIWVREGDAMSGPAACKRLGIDLDRCLIWQGMPVVSEGGERMGFLDDVAFDPETGKLEWIAPSRGATATALLGEARIPRSQVIGFKTGIGDELNVTEGEGDQEREVRGAIVVSDRALAIQGEGGLADAAGAKVAVAAEKVRRKKDAAKPKVSSAAKATEKAIGKGAYATGRQLSRAKGMFSAFKNEYQKEVSGVPKRPKR